jgi:hypothetical protein
MRSPVIVIGRFAFKFARDKRGRVSNLYEATLYRNVNATRRALPACSGLSITVPWSFLSHLAPGISVVANSLKTCYPRKDCCFRSPTIEAAMSDDPDLSKANHALLVIRQARLSRSEVAAIMIGDLIYEIANTGPCSPEIEGAHEAARLAISKLASSLKSEQFAPPAVWKAALRATESWRELLI